MGKRERERESERERERERPSVRERERPKERERLLGTILHNATGELSENISTSQVL